MTRGRIAGNITALNRTLHALITGGINTAAVVGLVSGDGAAIDRKLCGHAHKDTAAVACFVGF